MQKIDLLLPAFMLVVGFALGATLQHRQDQTECRHTIQRSFMKTREEAERILEEQISWERR